MININQKLVPVTLFVYNRLNNTRQVVEALKKNYLAKNTDVFVFSDAPKTEKNKKKVDEVRNYLKTVTGFKSFTVIEREENYYIEKNIIDGVTEIINKFGRIIVLEDDGVTAKNFLTFMNDALNFYDDKKKVMHIGTFTFIDMPIEYKKTILWSYTENTGGGWGTWSDRWDKFKWFKSEEEALSVLTTEQKKKIEFDGAFRCLNLLKYNPITWDICWLITVVSNNGLAVNSPRSLTKNVGLFSGTHFSAINRVLGKSPFEVELYEDEDIEFEEVLEENPEATRLLKEFWSTLGKRKRDKILGGFIKILVILKITKLLKKIFK